MREIFGSPAFVLLLLGSAACTKAVLHPPQALAPCVRGEGAAADFRVWIQELATTADSEEAEMRDSLKLPRLADTSLVAFETDPAICARAAEAFARATRDTTRPARPVYLLRVGPDRYIAWNYSRVGEFFVYYVFDRRLRLIEEFIT